MTTVSGLSTRIFASQRLADSGRILGRDPAAVQDRFALAEQEGLFLARGLLGGQPLQRVGVRRRLVTDDDPAGVGAERHDKRRAEVWVGRADLPLERLARAVGDALDLKTLVVEDDFPGIRLGLDVERRGSADPLGGEIDAEVERDVRDPRFQRPGIAMDVDRVRRVEDWRDLPRFGGGWRCLLSLAGHQEQGRDGGRQEADRQEKSPG